MSENEKELNQGTPAEEGCTHDCSTCASKCGSQTASKEDFYEPLNQYSSVRHVIGVVSG